MKKLFILFGAAITLLPIFFGELRWFEYIPLGILASVLATAGIIMVYNAVKNRGAEQEGVVKATVPYKERILYSAAGSFIASLIAVICL